MRLVPSALSALTAAVVAASPSDVPAPRVRSAAPACSAPEYRQFAFFDGDWDAFDVGAPTVVVARDRVTPILGGCAAREWYEQTDGLVGEGLSTYDAARHVWHQSWTTNRGQLLLLEGGFAKGRMSLAATDHAADGTTSRVRVVWYREGATVRETAERSTDDGATWRPLFDIVFRPHAGSRRTARHAPNAAAGVDDARR